MNKCCSSHLSDLKLDFLTSQGVPTMSAETVSSAMSNVTLDAAAGDAVAAGDAIYTSELRGSDEAGKLT
jgi:hypothetical protein